MLRSVPSEYALYPGTGTNVNNDIMLYMTQERGVLETAQFEWDANNNWTARVAAEPGATPYYVYGYMPADAATVSITPPASPSTYANGATMVLTGLNTVSSTDVCVVSGAKTETNTSTFDIINSTTAVTPGSFDITVVDGDNYIYLLMNHIYAKVGLTVKVEGPSSDFYKLRAIKLKKVQMKTGIGEVAVTIQNNPTTPVQIDYAAGAITDQTITIFDVSTDEDATNDTGVEITPTGTEVPAFLTPLQAGTEKDITFISTYDVYYRNPDGTISNIIVRENCTATNEWKLKTPDSRILGAGEEISVSATIIPTYLYQLADPDLDNPTIKIQ